MHDAIAETAGLVDRLSRLQAATVGDVLDEMGLTSQVLSADIHPLSLGMRAVGPAFCIQGRDAEGSTVEPTSGASGPGYEMFRRMYPGCIAVIDTGGHSVGGPWGENSALSARAQGCEGVLIDGGSRDAHELTEIGFATFARFATPARVEGRWRQTAFEVPIAMPGQCSEQVVIDPGDLVLGDADGVVVIPRPVAAQVVADAERVTRIEERIRAELVAGVDREEVYRRHARYRHIEPRDR